MIFFFLLVLSTSAYSGEKFPIEEERDRIELELNKSGLKESKKVFCQQYLEVLTLIRDGEPGKGLQKYPQQLSRNKMNRIQAAIKSLPVWTGGKVSSTEIYQFLDYIELNKHDLKAAASDSNTYEFYLASESKVKEVTLVSSLRPKPSLFLDFGKFCPQEGSCKSFKKVVQYKAFEPVAELSPHCDSSSLKYFNIEIEILKLLATVPNSEKLGVADLLGYLPNRFFQTLADFDLQDFYERDMGTLSQKIHILSQLASGGLVPLHKLGISHNDIKFENILIRDLRKDQPLHPQRFAAIYNDFGLSTQPKLDLKEGKKRFCGGTPYTMAPELFKGWIGTEEKKVENYLKADVYSQAMVALLLLRPHETADLEHCFDSKKTPFESMTCRDQEWSKLNEKYLQNEKYDALEHLFRGALEEDPTQRITAEQFSRAITHIESKLEQSKTRLGYNLGYLNREFGDFPNYVTDGRQIPEPVIGGYLLKSIRVDGFYFLALHYFDKNLFQRMHVLDSVSPDDLDDEIEFLRDLGVLKAEPV